ncbi:alpha/beta hydrolase [Kineococcus rhizosphaerae]|uniref:Acetyl esterase/lipase n=1 Tax=Kineococcus rhizosphaerae TaxID=559628 RepID=A0A2T0R2E6_9ACTN|nr:alpha/beta hydrolase [Kineococcus rhizosphaerae]PRY13945.1 acetyl esterase/lipase [Kineococcus rhizosphaerae]
METSKTSTPPPGPTTTDRSQTRRPPYDPGVAAALETIGKAPVFAPLTLESITQMRQYAVPEDISALDLEQRDYTVPGYGGEPLTLTVLRRRDHVGAGPGVFNVHGGGMVMGNRMTGISLVAPWVAAHDVVAVSVEYRLAPEHPDPVPVEDCYAALCWVGENADDLQIDPARILLAGASAGGGLAAGVALLARDRGGPNLVGQFLLCPMLDDRDATVSTHQFDGLGAWDRSSNLTGWTALLGERRASDDVSIYAAPARALDLSGLPPTYLDVGSAEVFRDETVAYASKLWEGGVAAELHVWPGGTHGWEAFIPGSVMAHTATAARESWVTRLLQAAAKEPTQ